MILFIGILYNDRGNMESFQDIVRDSIENGVLTEKELWELFSAYKREKEYLCSTQEGKCELVGGRAKSKLDELSARISGKPEVSLFQLDKDVLSDIYHLSDFEIPDQSLEPLTVEEEKELIDRYILDYPDRIEWGHVTELYTSSGEEWRGALDYLYDIVDSWYIDDPIWTLRSLLDEIKEQPNQEILFTNDELWQIYDYIDIVKTFQFVDPKRRDEFIADIFADMIFYKFGWRGSNGEYIEGNEITESQNREELWEWDSNEKSREQLQLVLQHEFEDGEVIDSWDEWNAGYTVYIIEQIHAFGWDSWEETHTVQRNIIGIENELRESFGIRSRSIEGAIYWEYSWEIDRGRLPFVATMSKAKRAFSPLSKLREFNGNENIMDVLEQVRSHETLIRLAFLIGFKDDKYNDMRYEVLKGELWDMEGEEVIDLVDLENIKSLDDLETLAWNDFISEQWWWFFPELMNYSWDVDTFWAENQKHYRLLIFWLNVNSNIKLLDFNFDNFDNHKELVVSTIEQVAEMYKVKTPEDLEDLISQLPEDMTKEDMKIFSLRVSEIFNKIALKERHYIKAYNFQRIHENRWNTSLVEVLGARHMTNAPWSYPLQRVLRDKWISYAVIRPNGLSEVLKELKELEEVKRKEW